MQKRNKVFFVLSCVFSGLSCVGTAFCLSIGIEFLRLQAQTDNNLGQGIAAALLAVFFIIFSIATAITAILSGAFSFPNIGVSHPKFKTAARILLVFEACLLVFTAIFFFAVIGKNISV